jgi:DNA processing protein
MACLAECRTAPIRASVRRASVALVTALDDRAALVSLLRNGTRPWTEYAELIEERGSALAVLDEDQGLFARDGLGDASAQIALWERCGIRILTVLDPDYPENLHAVHDRPPVVFVAGRLRSSDARAVAVVGSRAASAEGLARARAITARLVDAGYTVTSGLAAGVDTAAHTTALRHGGRTIAVIGTGLGRSYPDENAELQRRIASECAVVSQFWPDARPTQTSFPARNAVMSGLSLATVVVEATATSGARGQARIALAHGRPVFLAESLLEQDWARACSRLPGAHVIGFPNEIVATLDRLTSPGALVG